MISEHIKACDALIAGVQEIVDNARELPLTRNHVRLLIAAENTLKSAQDYKDNSLELYDSFFKSVRDMQG